jgi:HEPN domain-containing protein
MSENDDANIAQWREALRWLGFAAEDLRVASLTLADQSVLGATAFHVQQASKKILKALLVAAAADFRRIHDVEELAEAAHRHWPHVVSSPFPLSRATSWYIDSRYPGLDEPAFDFGDIAAAFAEAEALMYRVSQLVPAELRGG